MEQHCKEKHLLRNFDKKSVRLNVIRSTMELLQHKLINRQLVRAISRYRLDRDQQSMSYMIRYLCSRSSRVPGLHNIKLSYKHRYCTMFWLITIWHIYAYLAPTSNHLGKLIAYIYVCMLSLYEKLFNIKFSMALDSLSLFATRTKFSLKQDNQKESRFSAILKRQMSGVTPVNLTINHYYSSFKSNHR